MDQAARAAVQRQASSTAAGKDRSSTERWLTLSAVASGAAP